MSAQKSNVAYYAKLAGVLLIISLVVAGMLGVVNGMTADIIAEAKAAKKAEAMSVVLADCSFEEVAVTEDMVAASAAFESELASVYAGKDSSGAAAGYVMEVTPSGFGGAISMVVGVDAAGKVTGVSVISNSETAGVGTKVTQNKNNKSGVPVLDQFIGKSAADGELTVGTNVDAVSGATVSSKAVTRGVNAALAVKAILG